ncbi:MAG: hypothetical protein ACOC83_00865 [Gemmatimonadota bacterium]
MSLSGCSLLGPFATGPSGLSNPDDELRRLLRTDRADEAVELLEREEDLPGDDLLRAQYEGLVLHYAGEWEASNEALQRAAAIAEERYTKSISKALLSAITSDRVLPYDPPLTERLFLHYYGALNYLRLGDPEEAAVEARLLSRVLRRAGEEGGPGAGLRGSLHLLCGFVFETAGELSDAEVSYRLARALGAPAPDGPGEGGRRVLALAERGFVAHRVERSANLLVWPGEIRSLRMEADRLREDSTARAPTAFALAARVLAGDGEGAEGWSGSRYFGSGSNRARSRRDRDGDPVLFRVAWPAYRDEGSLPSSSTAFSGLVQDGMDRSSPAGEPAVLSGDVSSAVRDEFRRDAPLVIAKALLRGVLKHEISKAIEKEVSEEDETLGEVAGVLAQAAGAILERADTRSWHLLPARLDVTVLRAPADDGGSAFLRAGVDSDARLRLDPVRWSRDGLAVATVRLWR